MTLKSIPGGRIGNFLAGAAVASVVSGVAFAVTSPDFTYSAAQTGYLTLGPMAMTPDDSNSADDYLINPLHLYNDSTTGACFVTGVNLPKGAILRNLTVYFTSDNIGDLQVSFFRTRLANKAFVALINKQPVENTSSYVRVSYPFPPALSTIDNAAFAYSLRVCLADGTTYSGARIQYTYRTAGD